MKFLQMLLGLGGSTGILPAPGVRFINKIGMTQPKSGIFTTQLNFLDQLKKFLN